MALVEDSTTLSAYLDDFGVSCTSGSCSAVVMGDFSQAILGLYGSGIEITAGEDSDDFAKNLVSVKGVVAFDVAVRHAQSFAAILDVTT